MRLSIKPKITFTMYIFTLFLPFTALSVELATEMSAESLLNPLPSMAHTIILSLLVLINGMICYRFSSLERHCRLATQSQYKYENVKSFIFLISFSMGISFYYFLIFIPFIPVGLLAIIIFGLGLLILSPLLSLIYSIRIYNRLRELNPNSLQSTELKVTLPTSPLMKRPFFNRNFYKGFFFSFFLLLALEIQPEITFWAAEMASSESSEKQERGYRWLKQVGDETLLFDQSLKRPFVRMGLISHLRELTSTGFKLNYSDSYEIYYRLNGKLFSDATRSDGFFQTQSNSRQGFDRLRGTQQIGPKIKQLNLLNSQLNATANTTDAISYIEWTFSVENKTALPQESRLELLLPSNSVVSRATLWINGEEREAAYAKKNHAMEAYQEVVRKRMDPLLVSAHQFERVFIQAFPINANGGVMTYKIGITVPLSLSQQEKLVFELPLITNSNFVISDEFEHFIWLEADQPINLSSSLMTSTKLDESITNQSIHRLKGTIKHSSITSPEEVAILTNDQLDKNNSHSDLHHRIASFDDKIVLQQISLIPNKAPPKALIIVVDASIHTNQYKQQFIRSLDNLSTGQLVGLIIANKKVKSIPLNKWSEAQKSLFTELILSVVFEGGQDNAPALSKAITQLEPFENSELFWFHSPQQLKFEPSNGELNQVIQRVNRRPNVVMYALNSQPNQLLVNNAHNLITRRLFSKGKVAEELSDYFLSLYSSEPKWIIHRILIDEDTHHNLSNKSDVYQPGSNHIARLWAFEEIKRLLKTDKRTQAIALALQFKLVTPISAAVVLENQEQYDRNNLKPVDKEDVPSIPESSTFFIFLFGIAFLLTIRTYKRFQ